MNGSIRKRGERSWELTIDLGRDTQGKRLRKFVHVKGTKAEAEMRLRELLTAHDKGMPVDQTKIRVAEFLLHWLKDYAIPNTRPRTTERYEGDIRNHLVPHIGHIQMTRLTPRDIQAMEAAMLKRGLSPKSVQNAHRVLSEALSHAVQWGLLYYNPCVAVKPPKLTHKEIQIPDGETVQHLLARAKDTPYYPVFHFLAFTGARRGEACGLMWKDIDMERGTVSIGRAAVRIKGKGLMMLPPKTERSKRVIAIDTDTIAVLRAHKGAQLVRQVEIGADLYGNQGFVFSDVLGQPFDPSIITDAWRRLVAKAGVGRIRLHDLRHFHASMLLRANIHPKIVQERLGRSTVSITLDTYSHSVPSLQQQAAESFAEVMRNIESRNPSIL